MNKSQKQILLLTAFAAGAIISGAFQYVKEIVGLAEELGNSNGHFSDFMQGMAVGLNLTSFLMIFIIGLLVIVFAQIFKIAYKMQQKEELTV